MLYGETKLALYRNLTVAGVAGAVLLTAWQVVMMGFFYDSQLHFFEEGAALTVLQCLVVLVLLLAAVGGVLLSRKSVRCSGTLPALSSAEALLSALCGFFLLATVIMQLIYSVSGLDVEKYDISRSVFLAFLSRTGESAVLSQTLQSVALLCALPGSFYFLYPAFSEKPKESVRAAFGLFFLVWAALSVLVTNFQMDIPMNSPERLGSMAALVCILLFTVSEQRFLYGRGKLGALYATGTLAMAFAFADGLSSLLYAFAGRLEMGISTIYACVELSLALYAAVRLLSFAKLTLFQSREEHDASVLDAAKKAAEGGKHDLIPARGPREEFAAGTLNTAAETKTAESESEAMAEQGEGGKTSSDVTTGEAESEGAARPHAVRKPRL